MTLMVVSLAYSALVICLLGLTIAFYHHVLYPAALHLFARRARAECGRDAAAGARGPAGAPPRIAVLVPVFNEADQITAKIANLAELDYPAERLEIVVTLDGCTDATADLARGALAALAPEKNERFTLREHLANRGKVAVVNAFLGLAKGDVLVFTDTSARLERDALERIAAHFNDPDIGFVTGTYRVDDGDQSADYWRYQNGIKRDEAALGAPIGGHGACYAVRRNLLRALPSNTINDDFVLPMRAVLAGARGVYDEKLEIIEAEPTLSRELDWRRRARLGAGNLQQSIWLTRQAIAAPIGIAFCFFSGKWLRGFMPLIFLVTGLAGSLALLGAWLAGPMLAARPHATGSLADVPSVDGLLVNGPAVVEFANGPLLFAALAMILAGVVFTVGTVRGRRLVRAAMYAGLGYAAMACGAIKYLSGGMNTPWRPARLNIADPHTDKLDTAGLNAARLEAAGLNQSRLEIDYIPPSVRISKRVLDLVCAAGVLIALGTVIVPVAIAIKLESRGPIFYRQLRVGRQKQTATEIFWLIKFRSMYIDAETRSGAVWASKNDPRITRVGNFLRKTRLDELPQAINIFRGEMSIIGPRPERPVFFRDLEEAIPFYTERTYGLRPGVTGLAQVSTGYDASVEDVRTKVLYDHVYAARLTSWWRWLLSDLEIILQTVKVMALKKGV